MTHPDWLLPACLFGFAVLCGAAVPFVGHYMIWALRRLISLNASRVLVACLAPATTMALLMPTTHIYRSPLLALSGYTVGMFAGRYLDRRAWRYFG